MLWTESFLVFFQSQEYGIQELMVESDTKVMGLSLFVHFFFFPGEAAKAKVQKSILSFQIFLLNCLIIAVFMIWLIFIAFFTSIGLAFLT